MPNAQRRDLARLSIIVVVLVGPLLSSPAASSADQRPRGRLTEALLPHVADDVVVGEHISSYDVDIGIEPSGDIDVRETIAYDFGTSLRHGIFRDIPTRVRRDDHFDRLYDVEILGVSGSPGTPTRYTVDHLDGSARLVIGDPTRLISGMRTYEIEYRVGSALNGFRDHDELYWDVIGSSWNVPILAATVRVSGPPGIGDIACFSGPAGSRRSWTGMRASPSPVLRREKG